ncbi:hypothetical protein GCM10027399_11870 [Curvibacter fontanus]|jgi:hypothetical protein
MATGTGFHVAGYDLRAEAREALAAPGVQAAATLADVAAAAGCMVLAVFNTDDVPGVVEGADGLLSVPGVRHILDCSTGTPDALEALAARLKKRGVDFIEAPLSRIIDQCAERGIRAISPWRDPVAAVGLAAVARQLRAQGMRLSDYCRGGFFPAADAAGLCAALDDDRRAIDEAKTLNAPCLVLVADALPGALAGRATYKELGRARAEVHDGIARVRARRTCDLLSDRGMMGDGVIELRKIRGWVEQAGHAGYSEVEIFSEPD